MMRLTNLILATLIVAGQLLTAAPEEQNVLTLDQAIALALENNRSLKNATLNVGKAQNQVAATRTYRLPAVNSYILGARQLSHADLKFDKGALGVLPGVGPVPAQDTTIRSSGRFSALLVNQVTQPISQLHRIGLAIKQAEIGVETAKQQVRTEQHSVVANVKTAYYSILQTQSSLRAAEQNIRSYRELDRLTEEYVLQRVSLKSESLEIKTRLAKAELDALSLQDALATQKEQLNALLGRSLETDFSVKLAAEAELVDIDLRRAQATALEERPEISQAKLKVTQAEIDRRSKRSEFIPDVSLNFSQTSPINYSDVLPGNLTTIGIAVNWNVVDWGRKKQELAAKAASVVQADNSLKDTESLVIREVNSNFRKLEQKARMLRVAELAQETAAETLRVTTNSYRVNAALFKDVLQSESAMEQANDQYQQALLSLWTAKSEFEKSLGEDHD
jgi:outer membrane protein TolC